MDLCKTKFIRLLVAPIFQRNWSPKRVFREAKFFSGPGWGVIDRITPAALSAAHSAASGRKRGISMRISHRNTLQFRDIYVVRRFGDFRAHSMGELSLLFLMSTGFT